MVDSIIIGIVFVSVVIAIAAYNITKIRSENSVYQTDSTDPIAQRIEALSLYDGASEASYKLLELIICEGNSTINNGSKDPEEAMTLKLKIKCVIDSIDDGSYGDDGYGITTISTELKEIINVAG